MAIILPVLPFVALAPTLALAAPALTGNGSSSHAIVNDGKIVLDYSKEPDAVIELHQAPTAGFSESRVRYRGADSATVLTGLAEGDYYFRIRAVDEGGEQPWSNVVHVDVEYMDRNQLWVLLVTGFTVVALTAGAILIGSRRANAEASAP